MKINLTFTALFAATVLFLASCANQASKPIDMTALRTEIQSMEDAYAAAEKAKDAAGVAAYYSDDAISYGRNTEPMVGKAAIQNRIAERLAKDTLVTDNVYKVVDLFAEGDKAVEIGSWKELDANGNEINHGHYMSYFEKRNGKYVCVRDMNVTSMPEKTAGM